MLRSRPPVGLAHPTVVPENFEDVEDSDDAGETAGESEDHPERTGA